jgi:bifunctional UDP-N-acetylglucosamine pyrophosphorylase/glucosamine-1-phosphate N-acetyltransferase
MPADLNVVVLAAGEGKRLPGAIPKVLTPLWGLPAICWPVDAALGLLPERTVVVAGARHESLRAALADRSVRIASQARPEGTGAAVLAARSELSDGAGPLLVLYGDGPLVDTTLLADLVAAHRQAGAIVTVLTAVLPDPTGYGRVVRDERGELAGIVEERDADAPTRALHEVNTGLWVVERPQVWEDLAAVGRANAQGEIYLTDLVRVARERGRKLATVGCEDPARVLGFNDHRELAIVRAVLRRRILDRLLRAGVEIVDPDSTWIDATVSIEPGARILPATVIEGRCRIAAGCEVGPFAHLRTGTVMEAGSEVGNFTETKQAVLGPGAKAKHLSYLGDATIGARANIGAGTITANYDGRAKHATTVGANAFIGSGTVLVAPVSVGDHATTGAGAVVTRRSEVGPGETWVGVPARKLRGPESSA